MLFELSVENTAGRFSIRYKQVMLKSVLSLSSFVTTGIPG